MRVRAIARERKLGRERPRETATEKGYREENRERQRETEKAKA